MSAVEGIKSVPCICVSICYHSHDWTVWDTNLKFGVDKFEGQSHRSKIKVTILKNVIFELFDGVAWVDCTNTFCDDMMSCDVTIWSLLGVIWVVEGLSSKNTDKEGMMREGLQRSGVFIWHRNGEITTSVHSGYNIIIMEKYTCTILIPKGNDINYGRGAKKLG